MPEIKKEINPVGSSQNANRVAVDQSNISNGINWRAAEFDYSKKNTSWYLVMGGIAVILIVFALWQKNFFFALFIAVASAIVLFFGKRRPQVFDFSLGSDKVKIGERISYEYKNLENFSIHERPGRLDELILRRKIFLNPYVRLPIDSKLALEARNFLRDKLLEVEHQESLLEIIIDWLRL